MGDTPTIGQTIDEWAECLPVIRAFGMTAEEAGLVALAAVDALAAALKETT